MAILFPRDHKRQYEYLDPYAGNFKLEYVVFLARSCTLFNDMEAVLVLRENAWYVEGKLEMVRKWETPQYRAKWIKRAKALGIPLEGVVENQLI